MVDYYNVVVVRAPCFWMLALDVCLYAWMVMSKIVFSLSRDSSAYVS